MPEKKSQSVTFEDVQKVATQMLSQGIKPCVRDVRKLTGGRNENVAEYLNRFNKKNDAEVLQLSDEIGSSEIGKLIAGEVQARVIRRTTALNEICQRQEAQIEELISLLKDNEKECSERVALAEAESAKATSEAGTKIEKYIEKTSSAEQAKSIAEELLSQTQSDTRNTIASIEQKAQLQVESAQAEAKSLIGAAKTEANSLVAAANKQTDKAESETISLREQVKLLSIDQARLSLEQEQFKQAQQQLDNLRVELADSKTSNVRFESQNNSLEKDTERLSNDLSEAKEQAKQLPKAQAQLVETQKQISKLQHDLAQSEREKDSLSRALAVSDSNQYKK